MARKKKKEETAQAEETQAAEETQTEAAPTEETPAEVVPAEETQAPAEAAAPAAAPRAVTTLDDAALVATYANLVRVMGSPEEVILDFGLNPNPFSTADQTINIDNRLVMNYYSAKRLYVALHQTLQRHEQNFGAIELDVRRRINPAVMQAAQQATQQK